MVLDAPHHLQTLVGYAYYRKGSVFESLERGTGRAISPQRLFVAGSGSVAGRVERYRSHLEAFEAKYPDDRRKLKSKSHLLCPWVDEIARKSCWTSMRPIGEHSLLQHGISDQGGGRQDFCRWHQDGAYNPIKPILVIGDWRSRIVRLSTGVSALSRCTRRAPCRMRIPVTRHSVARPIHHHGFRRVDGREHGIESWRNRPFYSEIIHGSSVNTSDAGE